MRPIRIPCRSGRAPLRVATLAFVAAALAGPAGPGAPRAAEERAAVTAPTIGFPEDARPAQRRAEAVFMRTPAPERARGWLRALTEEPHVAGTEAGRRSAEYVRDRLREMGLKAELNTYEVLLNHPRSVALRLVEPEPVELSLREAGHAADKDSYSKDSFPAFHGYGASGKARGQVVYANYGRREDFEKLEALGIEVAGRIVVARYGQVFRGLKVKEAQERGALAVILYSDPADDGYAKGDIYPEGPMRPPSAIQRGSVRFLSAGAGDPSTPGYASTRNARRVPREQIDGIPKIPSLPIGYGEAGRILKALAGPNVPGDWQGALPFAYHLGPGPAEVEMAVDMDYAIRPIHNVIATIPGTVEADREVILGNHRDAWTYGAVDPNSGTTAMLEMARGLAAALSDGWRPRRTLILASWDGEEYALLGSTEWVEDRLATLGANAVAYVNLDAFTSGDLDVGGVPSLRDLLIEVARDVPEPRRGGSVLDAWRARRHADWARGEPAVPERAAERFEPHLNALGSGSDFTAFLDHAGIASLDLSFDGPYGVYHSVYDDFFWMEKFGDPEFLYHAAAARLFGLLAMRLAGADVVPLRYAPYGAALRRELDLLLRQTIRDQRVWDAARSADAAAAAPPAADPTAAVEARKRPPLRTDLALLRTAIERFAGAAGLLDAALDGIERRASGGGAAPRAFGALNDALVRVERAFLDPRGLPGRPWFRHTIYAPGFTTGYASWPFPGVVQALLDRDPAALRAALEVLQARLSDATTRLDAARALAEKSR